MQFVDALLALLQPRQRARSGSPKLLLQRKQLDLIGVDGVRFAARVSGAGPVDLVFFGISKMTLGIAALERDHVRDRAGFGLLLLVLLAVRSVDDFGVFGWLLLLLLPVTTGTNARAVTSGCGRDLHGGGCFGLGLEDRFGAED